MVNLDMFKYLLLSFIFLLQGCISAADSDMISCSVLDKMPKIDKGCFTEACDVLRYNKAIASTKLYEKPDTSSKLVGELSKCEKLEEFQVITKTLNLGKVKFLKDYKNFKQDNTAYLLSFAADGKIEFCHEKEILNINYHKEKKILKVIEWPKFEKWIELKYNNKKVYALYERENPFYMGHFDFDPSKKCQE